MATLYLIPTPLSDSAPVAMTTPAVHDVVRRLDTFVVENPKSARAVLKRYGYPRPLSQARLFTLDEHSNAQDLQAAFAPLLAGTEVGLMSEAGCPAVADPGADLVRHAHQHGIRVVPLVGPSSILLALMASGLNGQRFRFCGYLPAQSRRRVEAIRAVEAHSQREHETQIFIETPYRSQALFEALLATCKPPTMLCLATDLTGQQEHIASRTISEWRAIKQQLAHQPTVFLLLST